MTDNNYHFIEIQLQHNNKNINAIIAPQYAMQGMPIDKYGIKLNEILQNK